MHITRRHFLGAASLAAAPCFGFAAKANVMVGVCDWNLRLEGKPDAVALAARLGFEGLEVSLGRKPVDGKLPLDNPDMQAQYLAEFAKNNIGIAGTCLDIMHVTF